MSKFKTGIEITREVNGMIFRVPGENEDANDKKYLKLKLKEYISKEDLYKVLFNCQHHFQRARECEWIRKELERG